MGFRDILSKIGEKHRQRKELLKQMDDQLRVEKMLEDRQKSANERELERYMNEDREEMIKHKLEFARKKRDHDIKFNHNPLNAKNITNYAEWEVLKEKNQFANSRNVLKGHGSVMRNNPNLLRNNQRLFR